MEEVHEASDSNSSSHEFETNRRRRKRLSKLTIEDQFEHAINWNAVLLFDECEAYLGKRNDVNEKLILNSKWSKS